jgi:hypothetical protein
MLTEREPFRFRAFPCKQGGHRSHDATTEREPFRFRAFPDNRQHVVQQGKTLFSLAGRYFAPLPRASGLWWVIADFQPDPVHDPRCHSTSAA